MAQTTEIAARALQIRRDIITMLAEAGSGHPGGSLSAADIMATLYFGGVLRHFPDNPCRDDRDRFVLSKGHVAPVLYATLAEAGYLPREELVTLRKLGSRLQGHPDCRKLPGVEVSTGSLGQGLSVSCGIALGLSMSSSPARVFTLLGDGELDEGQVWEAAEFAAHYHLSNLVAIVDNNSLQIDGHTDEVMCLRDIPAKFAAFGWAVTCVDGHDIAALLEAFQWAESVDDGPAVIVARTIKGKGVSFMEDQAGWHGKAPDAEQARAALAELDR